MAMLEARVPGDKSIAHRALVLGGLASGESRLSGMSGALDVASTAGAMRALGVRIERDQDGIRIQGSGARALRPPKIPLDCGNSGTTARMVMGVAAALRGETAFTGDDSLRGRPMERVAEPLRTAGADIEYLGLPGRLPLLVRGAELRPIEHRSYIASAQVKSALLLAGIAAGVDVRVSEPTLSRDHTERMLRAMGATLVSSHDEAGAGVRLEATPALNPLDVTLPGDFSSAAFLLAASLIGGGAGVMVRDVGVNPTRTGLLDVLGRMGADVRVEAQRERSLEPVADLFVVPCDLRGTRVEGGAAVRMIDELPLLAVLAAHARGQTSVGGVAELRTKESDRIHAVCANLRALGVDVEETPDGFVVEGTEEPLAGRVRSFGDHRIAMAFAVLGLRPGSRIEVDDLGVVAVSFPGFEAEIERMRVARGSTIGGGTG